MISMRLTNDGITFYDDGVEVKDHDASGVVLLPDVPVEYQQIDQTVTCEYCGVSSVQNGGTCPFCGAPLPRNKPRYVTRDRTGIETAWE